MQERTQATCSIKCALLAAIHLSSANHMTALHEQLADVEIEALGAEGARLAEDQAVAEALAV